MPIIKIETCTSTNSFLKELSCISDWEEGTVLSTGEQTAGRGQAGTQWETEAGKCLAFSMLFRPSFLPISSHFLLSEAIALGVKKALDKYVPDIFIKWANDIFYRDKKLVGILIENEITGQTISQSIVGIGINVNQEEFRSDAPNPVSLKQIIGVNVDLDILLKELSETITYHYELLREEKWETLIRAYHESLFRKDGFHRYKDRERTFLARIDSVANDGIISLTDDKGETRRYAFKEVSFLY